MSKISKVSSQAWRKLSLAFFSFQNSSQCKIQNVFRKIPHNVGFSVRLTLPHNAAKLICSYKSPTLWGRFNLTQKGTLWGIFLLTYSNIVRKSGTWSLRGTFSKFIKYNIVRNFQFSWEKVPSNFSFFYQNNLEFCFLLVPHNVGFSVRLILPHNVAFWVRLTLPHNVGVSVRLSLPHNVGFLKWVLN